MNRLTSLFLWLLRIGLFVALFGLAIKNSDPLELRFFFEKSWQVPVSVLVLASFAAGVLVGLTAISGRSLRRRLQDGH